MIASLGETLKHAINAAAFKGDEHQFINIRKRPFEGCFTPVWEQLLKFDETMEGHRISKASKLEKRVTRSVAWVYPRDMELMAQFVAW
jgi:hypothetical protein